MTQRDETGRPTRRDVLRADQTKWTMKALSIEHGVNFHKVEYTEPVPGGWGINAQLENEVLLEFLRVQARGARFITSVCSGAGAKRRREIF